MANNILLLEDDMSLIDGLQYSLKKNGYPILKEYFSIAEKKLHVKQENQSLNK